MSSSSTSPPSARKQNQPRSEKAKSPQPVEFKPPLKPQRGLLRIFTVAVIIWVALLLALYFVSVYPQRHGPGAKPEIHESDAPER